MTSESSISLFKRIAIAVFFLTIAVSKHLIILNEEILVALSFVCFLVFSSRTFSDSICETFQVRTLTTQNELQNYLQTQLEITRELAAYHAKYLQTQQTINKIANIVRIQLQQTAKTGSNQLRTVCVEQIHERLQILIQHHTQFQRILQKEIIDNFKKKSQ